MTPTTIHIPNIIHNQLYESLELELELDDADAGNRLLYPVTVGSTKFTPDKIESVPVTVGSAKFTPENIPSYPLKPTINIEC